MELSEVTIKYLLSCSTILHRVKNKFSFMVYLNIKFNRRN